MLSEIDFEYADNQIRRVGIIADISLEVKERDDEKNGNELCNLKAGVLRKLCLKRLKKQGADKENKGVESIYGKKLLVVMKLNFPK